MYKLIDSRSFFPEDEPIVTVIDFNESKGLLKTAADSRIQEYVSQIIPSPNKIYVHILAMGAGEYYGANRNADYFPEHNLIDYHKTFETSPAHIFRNHVNKRPEIAIGKVLFAIYNSRMHRVELIADIDMDKAPDVVERVERGEFPATSMACKTPYDVCSICGNKAHTRQEYCIHLREQLGKVYPDGRKVMSLNVAPLKFFDMSIVIRPADVTSSVLQKVAMEVEFGVTVENLLPTIGSAEVAEEEGLLEEGVDKQATIQKLSEFIKEVDSGNVVNFSDNLDTLLNKVQDPDLKIIDALVNFKLPEILSTMAHLGISPSIAFLSELIGRKTFGDSVTGMGSMVESLVNQTGAANIALPKEEHLICDPISQVAGILAASIPTSSLHPQFVEKRASFTGGTNVGYNGNGPYIEPYAYEKYQKQHLTQGDEKSNLMKFMHTLLIIGGQALIAKWYITKTINEKMKENAEANNHGVKIILVKSASEYALTYKLAKAAMVRALKSK